MIAEIALDLIDPPRDDDRLERSPESIARLAADIAAVGLIHPPTVRAAGERYECVAGWTRILALRSLGRGTCLCSVSALIDDRTASRIRLAENLQREDLTPIEEAVRLARLVTDEQISVDAIAALVHRAPEWVAQRLNLLAIPDDLQARVHTRELAIGAALALGRCTDPQYRMYLLHHALEGGATVATVRAWVAQWEVQRASAIDAGEPLPDIPVLNQMPTVTVPCARCHAPHDVGRSTIIRVCQACGREIERELRTLPS